MVENFRPDVKKRLGIDYKTLGQDQSAPRLCQHLRLRPGRPLCRPARLRPDRAGHGRADVDHRPAGPGPGARRHSDRRSHRRACSRARHPGRAARTREVRARARRSRPRCCRRRSSCSISRRARYLVEGEVAEAGRQQSPDQHSDRRVQDHGRLHQHRHHRAARSGSASARRSAPTALMQKSGLPDRRGALEEPRRAQCRDRQLSARPHQRRMGRAFQQGRRAVRADLCDRPDVRRSAGRASRHRAERDQARTRARCVWSASR